MPAAYSDGFSYFQGLNSERDAVYTIPEHDYRNLVDSLAPSQADLTISTQSNFILRHST